jgi:hypothetical protein
LACRAKPSAIKAKQLKDCDAKLKGLKAQANGSQLPKEDMCMRRFLFGLFVIVLLTSFVLPVAAIQTDSTIENASEQLDSTISKAIEKGDSFADKGFLIDSIQIITTAENVVTKTEKIVEKLESKIDGDGLVLVPEYIPINIGGIVVIVDPFHVF